MNDDYVNIPAAQLVEHSVSSAKGHGFDAEGTQTKKS